MATSKELLRDAACGAEVRIDAVNVGGLVEYAPRYKGDRQPWALREGLHVYRYAAAKCVAVWPEAPATEEVKEEETVTNSNITPEVVEALRTLRNTNLNHYGPLWRALNVLDNAGIFSAIDEATDYDTDPAPEQISECTCPPSYLINNRDRHQYGCPGDPAEQISQCTCPASTLRRGFGHLQACPDYPAPERVSRCTCPAQDHGGKHAPACPGDPAEWGDMAFGPVRTAVDNIRNAISLKF